MKQVLREGLKEIVVEEVPDPVVVPHHVLVRPCYSLISSGTETASIHQEGVLKEVSENPSHLRKVLDDTPIGHLTPPEVTKQGVEMVALCARKPTTIDTPKRKEMRDKMYAKKYEETSKNYLNEVRKGAMIEYR